MNDGCVVMIGWDVKRRSHFPTWHNSGVLLQVMMNRRRGNDIYRRWSFGKRRGARHSAATADFRNSYCIIPACSIQHFWCNNWPQSLPRTHHSQNLMFDRSHIPPAISRTSLWIQRKRPEKRFRRLLAFPDDLAELHAHNSHKM